MLLQVLFPKGKQPQRMMIGEGSGFFISADGYIVTNNHVAAHAQSVQITTDGGSCIGSRRNGSRGCAGCAPTAN